MSLSPAVPKPEHVPDSLFYDFDIHGDPGLLADPHARMVELLAAAPPVFWSPRNGGGWVALSHAANYAASRDTETFSSEMIPFAQLKAMQAARSPQQPHIPIPVPINLDPPNHTAFRGPLQKVFSPKTIAAMKDEVRALAIELIDAVKDQGHCEFMAEIAEQLPVKIFLRLMGMPDERYLEYRAVVKDYMKGIGATGPADMMARMRSIADLMRETMLDRRDNPQADLMSQMWNIEVDGQKSTIGDMENYGVLLFIAGLDTVMNAMGLAMRGLAQKPELQAQLRAEPRRIPEASEEMLRLYNVSVPVRFVRKEVELEGARMLPGDMLKLMLPAANLDPNEFPEPEKFDLNRENNVHIAFGVGPHRCLGSHLARVELQVLWEEMLARLPLFRLDPDHTIEYHGGHVMGISSMHLRWAAA
jgi:cytochrome P450